MSLGLLAPCGPTSSHHLPTGCASSAGRELTGLFEAATTGKRMQALSSAYDQHSLLAAQLPAGPYRLRVTQSATGTLMQIYTISSSILESQQQLIQQHMGPTWHQLPLALTIGKPISITASCAAACCPMPPSFGLCSLSRGIMTTSAHSRHNRYAVSSQYPETV